MINENDIHYEYDTRGYMLYYKGKPIGGAGIANEAKGCRANLKLFAQQAQVDKQRIVSGIESPLSLYMREIQRIDEENNLN